MKEYNQKKLYLKRALFYGMLLLLLVFTAGSAKKAYEGRRMQEDIAEKILRFHVRANSDGEEDQKLKLKVRDAVGKEMGELLQDAKTAEESSRIAREHFPEIIHIAKEVIRQEGYDYPVEVKLSSVEFPVKTYGSYTFPAGTYQALEVIIGAGMGHNWWCVMYPNMCFEGSVYEVVDDKSEKVLKDTLSETEYQSLMEEKNYKISWKWLDFWDK